MSKYITNNYLLFKTMKTHYAYQFRNCGDVYGETSIKYGDAILNPNPAIQDANEISMSWTKQILDITGSKFLISVTDNNGKLLFEFNSDEMPLSSIFKFQRNERIYSFTHLDVTSGLFNKNKKHLADSLVTAFGFGKYNKHRKIVLIINADQFVSKLIKALDQQSLNFDRKAVLFGDSVKYVPKASNMFGMQYLQSIKNGHLIDLSSSGFYKNSRYQQQLEYRFTLPDCVVPNGHIVLGDLSDNVLIYNNFYDLINSISFDGKNKVSIRHPKG